MQILIPVLVMVALTAITVFRLAGARLKAVRTGEVPFGFYTTYRGDEPDRCRVLARHYSNLLEAPVLFYVAALVVLLTQRETALTVGLAWAYVVLRVLHSVVHTTVNDVTWRLGLFGLSWLALLALWGVIAWATLS